jgi:hypothetical protein
MSAGGLWASRGRRGGRLGRGRGADLGVQPWWQIGARAPTVWPPAPVRRQLPRCGPGRAAAAPSCSGGRPGPYVGPPRLRRHFRDSLSPPLPRAPSLCGSGPLPLGRALPPTGSVAVAPGAREPRPARPGTRRSGQGRSGARGGAPPRRGCRTATATPRPRRAAARAARRPRPRLRPAATTTATAARPTTSRASPRRWRAARSWGRPRRRPRRPRLPPPPTSRACGCRASARRASRAARARR